jgi:asparagine synthetase B (glutamine-hydrolysing)
MGMAEIGRQLAAGTNKAIQGNPAQCLLLSGGLDSSILAVFAPEVKALTTGLKGAHAPDVDYGMQVAAAAPEPGYCPICGASKPLQPNLD